MIVFDLKCSHNHVFEIWFKDSREFEKQKKKGLINCPICDDGRLDEFKHSF